MKMENKQTNKQKLTITIDVAALFDRVRQDLDGEQREVTEEESLLGVTLGVVLVPRVVFLGVASNTFLGVTFEVAAIFEAFLGVAFKVVILFGVFPEICLGVTDGVKFPVAKEPFLDVPFAFGVALLLGVAMDILLEIVECFGVALAEVAFGVAMDTILVVELFIVDLAEFAFGVSMALRVTLDTLFGVARGFGVPMEAFLVVAFVIGVIAILFGMALGVLFWEI